MKLDLNVHGIAVRIQGRGELARNVVANLTEDFAFARGQASGPPRIRLSIRPLPRSGSPFRIRAPFVFKTRACRVYGLGKTRVCDYGNVLVLSRIRRGRRDFVVLGNEAMPVYEAAYVALLSSSGEKLDQQGYHRIHALAYVRGELTTVLPLPSGGGKSSIAALMAADSRYRVYSDEIPLLKNGKLHSFPLRIALFPQVAKAIGLDPSKGRSFQRRFAQEKLLYPLPSESVAAPASPTLLLSAGKIPGMLFRMRFLWEFTLGLGTPQMAEHMLRADNLLDLARIALSRLSAGISLLVSVPCRSMPLSPDPLENKAWIDALEVSP